MAGSFNGCRHGDGKPVPAALGTKTKLRGGREDKESQVGFNSGGYVQATLSPALLWWYTGQTSKPSLEKVR